MTFAAPGAAPAAPLRGVSRPVTAALLATVALGAVAFVNHLAPAAFAVQKQMPEDQKSGGVSFVGAPFNDLHGAAAPAFLRAR